MYEVERDVKILLDTPTIETRIVALSIHTSFYLITFRFDPFWPHYASSLEARRQLISLDSFGATHDQTPFGLQTIKVA